MVAIGILGFLVIPLLVMKFVFLPSDEAWILPGIYLFGGLWLWGFCSAAEALGRKKRHRQGIQD